MHTAEHNRPIKLRGGVVGCAYIAYLARAFSNSVQKVRASFSNCDHLLNVGFCSYLEVETVEVELYYSHYRSFYAIKNSFGI